MPETLTANIQKFIQARYQTKLDALNKEYEKEKHKAITSNDQHAVESKFNRVA